MKRRALALAVVLATTPAVTARAAATPTVVAKGIPFATNIAFDPAGGMWVTSGAGAVNASDGVWYVPPGGKPLHVMGDVAYVAENGSTVRGHPVGSDIQRVNLRTRNRTRIWKSPVQHDPLGAAIGPDGDLYVTLFVSGEVVRFSA
jgi:hypothetical protein